MSNLLRRFIREEDGQDLVEYALLLALIAVVAAAGVGTLGTALNAWYGSMASSIPFAS